MQLHEENIATNAGKIKKKLCFIYKIYHYMRLLNILPSLLKKMIN